jgi:L-lactate dehydrogenase
MKVSIIGIGRVGSTLAYTLTLRGVCSELMLVNRSPNVAIGDMYDLQHTLPFLDKPMEIRSGDIADIADSNVVVVTCSVPMRADFTDRNELAFGNVAMFRELIPKIASAAPEAVLLILSNPVDVLTYYALQFSGFPKSRVLGSGTLIDSARFRSMLSQEVKIHPNDLRAYILGEHGQTQFAVMSAAQAGGEPIYDTPARRQLLQEAVQAGFKIFDYKGYTNYAVSMAATVIIECIVHDTRRTLPASVYIDGYYGERDVCLSMPVVVGEHGVERVLQPKLNDEELAAFRHSAEVVRRVIAATRITPAQPEGNL